VWYNSVNLFGWEPRASPAPGNEITALRAHLRDEGGRNYLTGDDEMSDTDTETQVETQVETAPAPKTETVKDEFDPARAMRTIEALRAEIKELKPKAKRADELTAEEQKRKEAELSEAQKLSKRLAETEAELKQLRIDRLRRDAAAKVDLPLVFADRLVGETPEELEADAKKILEALPKAPKTPNIGATNPGPAASQGETVTQQLARIHGQSINPFDPSWAKDHGGGVVIHEKPLAKQEQ